MQMEDKSQEEGVLIGPKCFDPSQRSIKCYDVVLVYIRFVGFLQNSHLGSFSVKPLDVFCLFLSSLLILGFDSKVKV